MNRQQTIEKLADLIAAVDRPHPLRVGIDGPGAAGKTTLADDLVEPLSRRGRTVLRASLDGFHNPPETRYRRGRHSVEGYYADSFNFDAVRRLLLQPLGPTGDRRFRRAVYDFRTESPVDAPLETAPPGAVLLFEGVFVLREELLDHWDYRLFVAADFDITTERAARRDADHFSSPDAVRAKYQSRYVPGQQMYLDRCQPDRRADAVLDNNNPATPRLLLPSEDLSAAG